VVRGDEVGGKGNILADATRPAVGAKVEAKYAASSPAVKSVVVMGKWTVAGWAGWLILNIVCDWRSVFGLYVRGLRWRG
jgi:hypothetical protein